MPPKTLSVYHKIEVGQREIYENEIEPLAQSFAMTVESMFDKIAALYKSGELNKHINKVKERVKSVLEPGSPLSGIDMGGGLYGAKLYDSARKKLVPVFGTPAGKSIAFKKSDKTMIVAPISLEGRSGIYAIIPNSKRLGGFIPEKSYVFADVNAPVAAGDLAVCIDTDFSALDSETTISAQIATIRQDSKGKIYGQLACPEEKINPQTMHKVIMVVME